MIGYIVSFVIGAVAIFAWLLTAAAFARWAEENKDKNKCPFPGSVKKTTITFKDGFKYFEYHPTIELAEKFEKALKDGMENRTLLATIVNEDGKFDVFRYEDVVRIGQEKCCPHK